MTDLTSFQCEIERLEEIVTAWQIPEPRPVAEEGEEENEAAATAETAARLVDLLGW